MQTLVAPLLVHVRFHLTVQNRNCTVENHNKIIQCVFCPFCQQCEFCHFKIRTSLFSETVNHQENQLNYLQVYFFSKKTVELMGDTVRNWWKTVCTPKQVAVQKYIQNQVKAVLTCLLMVGW